MAKRSTPLMALALAASLLLAGCVGTQGDDIEANAAASEVSVVLEAENVGDVHNLGFDVDSVHVHDANISLPDGFHTLDPATGHAHLVHDGEPRTVELASGELPAGTYDQVLIRGSAASVELQASDDDHEHDDGHDHGDGADDGHAHDHGEESDAASVDLPLNVTFEATADEPTEIVFTLDASGTSDGSAPSIAQADVQRGDETVATETDLETRAGPSDPSLPSDPPAPRISVFAPNGDQVLAPDFDPEEGEFANSVSSGFPAGEDVQYTATESEPVAEGAALESYEWDLGNGETASGQTAAAVYDEPGVYEVTLTVTDSYGNQDDHTVRVVVVDWTQTVAEASFEEDSDWTDETADEELNEWRIAEPGHGESSAAWHVGLTEDASDAFEAGYGPTNDPARLVSPEYDVPENFELVGYELFVDGYASAGQLELLVHVSGDEDEETRSLAVIGDEVEWQRLGGMDVLDDVAGSTVQFEAVFTANLDAFAEGPGYAIDGFTLAGMAEDDLVNHELLEESGGHGHDGHDHEH